MHWVTAANEIYFEMTIEILKEAVSWSIGDTLSNFTNFLHVTYESFLHLLLSMLEPSFIHKSFRDFLFNLTICSKQFCLHKDAIQRYFIGKCLDFLVVEDDLTTNANLFPFRLKRSTPTLCPILIFRLFPHT